jgi:hypothetical protein
MHIPSGNRLLGFPSFPTISISIIGEFVGFLVGSGVMRTGAGLVGEGVTGVEVAAGSVSALLSNVGAGALGLMDGCLPVVGALVVGIGLIVGGDMGTALGSIMQ